jgi:hypothetical protein
MGGDGASAPRIGRLGVGRMGSPMDGRLRDCEIVSTMAAGSEDLTEVGLDPARIAGQRNRSGPRSAEEGGQ